MLHLRVRKIDGEKVRKKLLKEKILNKGHQILKDGNFLYFPLQEGVKISDTEVVEREGKKIGQIV